MTRLRLAREWLRRLWPARERLGAPKSAWALDLAIGAALFASYLGWLIYSAQDLGYARDEGFYFHAARTYGKWFELLLEDPSAAIQPRNVDRYWRENHEHPALMKSLFWASQAAFDGSLFKERGTAYRFPAMVLSALAVSVIYGFGRRTIGRAAGVVAAVSFACMPRVFYHSHLACFDMPIVALCLLTVYAYYRSLEGRSVAWALGCGVIYGLALNTKHNAWLLPGVIGLHALSRLLPRPKEKLRAGHGFALLPLAFMLSIGPALFYATWPWIWRDTKDRLIEYVMFHWKHVYYNMEFLGQTYFEPPFPRSYAPLMTIATVPGITLLLAALGALGMVLGRRRPGRASTRPPGALVEGSTTALGHGLLWTLGVFVSYGPWLSPDTPIFGGTKHWMPAYPYLALFAGAGFEWLRARLRQAWSPSAGRERALSCGLAAAVLIGPVVMTWHSHPFGLSAYTPIVGGAPGAASLGLNRTFWGYTTGSVVDFMNERAGKRDRVFLHDTALDSFRMLQKDGRLRSDLIPWGSVAGSQLALYHHEQHMSRVEYMIWVDYGTTAPAYVATHDGVPVVWLYAREPRSPAASP